MVLKSYLYSDDIADYFDFSVEPDKPKNALCLICKQIKTVHSPQNDARLKEHLKACKTYQAYPLKFKHKLVAQLLAPLKDIGHNLNRLSNSNLSVVSAVPSTSSQSGTYNWNLASSSDQTDFVINRQKKRKELTTTPHKDKPPNFLKKSLSNFNRLMSPRKKKSRENQENSQENQENSQETQENSQENQENSQESPEKVPEYFIYNREEGTAICKLCVNEVIYKESTYNHKKSLMHTNNVKRYEIEPFRYLTMHIQEFSHLEILINESTIAEDVFAFHTLIHGSPFLLMDHLSDFMIELDLDRNFHCHRAKTSALVNYTFVKKAEENVLEEIQKTNYINLCFDTSTIKDTKLFVVLGKYYLPDEGLVTRAIYVRNIVHETSKHLTQYLMDGIREAKIDHKKIVAITGDNTNTNFGGVDHLGPNNIRVHFQEELGCATYSQGCYDHIFNNSARHTLVDSKEFKGIFNVKKLVNRVFTYFNQQIKRRDELFAIWAEKHTTLKIVDNTEIREIEALPELSMYVPTRWLSLVPSVCPMIKLFDTMGKLFDTAEAAQKAQLTEANRSKHVTYLDNFFKNEENLIWLCIIQDFFQPIHTKIKALQTRDATVMTGYKMAKELIRHANELLEGTRDNNIKHTSEISRIGPIFDQWNSSRKKKFSTNLATMYTIFVDYLEKWTRIYDYLENFDWISLDEKECESGVLTINLASRIRETYKTLRNKGIDIAKTDAVHSKVRTKDGLFFSVATNKELTNEITWLASAIPKLTEDWTVNKTQTAKRWYSIFQLAKTEDINLFNIKHIVWLVLCLSPTNAACESVFSEVNHFWSDWKTNLGIKTLQAFVKVKYNLTNSCKEFLKMRRDPLFLTRDEVKNSDKYTLRTVPKKQRDIQNYNERTGSSFSLARKDKTLNDDDEEDSSKLLDYRFE